MEHDGWFSEPRKGGVRGGFLSAVLARIEIPPFLYQQVLTRYCGQMKALSMMMMMMRHGRVLLGGGRFVHTLNISIDGNCDAQFKSLLIVTRYK